MLFSMLLLSVIQKLSLNVKNKQTWISEVQNILLTDKNKIEKSMYDVLPLSIILICYQGKYKYILRILYEKEKNDKLKTYSKWLPT